MTALAFDTLKAAKALREAGFEEAQAEAVVGTVSSAINENVASKADIEKVESAIDHLGTELRAEIDQVRTELRAEIDQVRTEFRAEIAALRQDMEARFERVDARFESLDARFESLEQKMTLKLGAMIAAAAGFIVVVDKLL